MKFTHARCLQQSKFIVENYIKKKSPPFPPLPTVNQLVKLYRIRASKHLSQNFLYDPAIINRFVRCLGKPLDGCYACEVGPGPGSITRSILEMGVEHLTVVEKDRRFLPMLQYISDVVLSKMTIVHGDILKYDIANAFPQELARPWNDECPPFCVFGNLPFNISLPLLFQWLDLISRQDGMFKLGRIPFVLTFQCEVAERLFAEPGTEQRSRLSVTSQYLCDIDYKFIISGRSFVPAPKVDVGTVKLTPRVDRLIDLPFRSVDHVVKHIMTGQRQRPCTKGVATLFPPKRGDLVQEMFRLSEVSPATKPVMLDNFHFRDLCYAFEDIAKRIPQLKLVDTYDPNQWRKYFDDQGDPRSDIEIAEKKNKLRKFKSKSAHFSGSEREQTLDFNSLEDDLFPFGGNVGKGT